MRLQIVALLAATSLLAACGSSTDECMEASGCGGVESPCAPTCGEGTVADFVDNVGDRVFFDFDRSNLRPDAMETLKRQACWLNKHKCYRVTVTGHCDKRGTTEYNLALGERRANAAKDQLVACGVCPTRIDVVSYGKERPVVEQDGSEWAYQQNRVAITVLDGR